MDSWRTSSKYSNCRLEELRKKMASKTRPTGVTILVILEVLSGLFSLLGGLALVAVGVLVGMPMMELPEFLGMIAGFLGVILLVFAVVSFALAYGLWNGKGWAWMWSLVFAAISAILALLQMISSPSSGIVQLIIAAIIIYYLTRPYVKTYFGKA
jgi:hypothetical protein